jgi:hypothetical protein
MPENADNPSNILGKCCGEWKVERMVEIVRTRVVMLHDDVVDDVVKVEVNLLLFGLIVVYYCCR